MIGSDELLSFLMGWESRGGVPDLSAYWDDIGDCWTVGFGHTGPEVNHQTRCTRDDAIGWLRADVMDATDQASKAIKVFVQQNQFDGFLSILYNVGPGSDKRDGIIRLKGGQPSTLLRKLNSQDIVGAALQFTLWDHGGGVVVPGLHKRRVAEQRIFMLGDYSLRP